MKLVDTMKQRVKDLSLAEISGSLGDLGTFLPLTLSLATFHAVMFSPALFWAGFYNLVTGFMWNTPMPVQPMKTIAAVVLASGDKDDPGLTPNETIGAGLSVSIIVLFLGVTKLVDVVNWLIPVPIVRGLQLGLGISMIRSGLKLNSKLSFASELDCILLSILCVVFVFVSNKTKLSNGRMIPAALILSMFGLIVALVRTSTSTIEGLTFDPTFPPFWAAGSLTGMDIVNGFLKAGLAQLPLTTLNSVISVCDLNNKNLFAHEKEKHVSRRAISSSVAMMNLSGLWFGAMPMCHGAGGLAAQYSFGARTGSALLILGLGKMLIAVLLGDEANRILEFFPVSILSVMLMFAGLSLSLAGLATLKQENKNDKDITILIATAAVTVALKTGWGFLAGVITAIFNGGFDHIMDRIVNQCCPSMAKRRHDTENDEDEEETASTGSDEESQQQQAASSFANLNPTSHHNTQNKTHDNRVALL